MSWIGALATVGLLGALAGGCGDPVLWARYRAERDLWKARDLMADLSARKGGSSEADTRRVASALRSIVERFPAERWTAPGQASPYARGVATASGRAAIALARLEEMQGRDDNAWEAYDRVYERYRGVHDVALEASLGAARVLDRCGPEERAAEAWSRVARGFPLVDRERARALVPVLEAALRVARSLAQRGELAAADSTLVETERRCERDLREWTGKDPAPDLWVGLAEARRARGAFEGAFDALRSALREPAVGEREPDIVLRLTEHSLEAGRADSALAYAAWAEHDLGERGRGKAMLLGARAWEDLGRPDSALGAYERFLDAYPLSVDSSALVRFRRGELLEKTGRWEQARTEYRVLAAAYPTHELALEALIREVRHHAERGELEMARIAGRRGLETVETLIETQRDEGIRARAMRARAELLLAVGRSGPACEAFAELWRRHPGSSLGAAAGLKAAEVAESTLHDRDLAGRIYRELAASDVEASVARRARAALERLARGPS